MNAPRFKIGDMVVLKTNVVLISKVPADVQWLTNRYLAVGQVNGMQEHTCSGGMQRMYDVRFYSPTSGAWQAHLYHEHELDPFTSPGK